MMAVPLEVIGAGYEQAVHATRWPSALRGAAPRVARAFAQTLWPEPLRWTEADLDVPESLVRFVGTAPEKIGRSLVLGGLYRWLPVIRRAIGRTERDAVRAVLREPLWRLVTVPGYPLPADELSEKRALSALTEGGMATLVRSGADLALRTSAAFGPRWAHALALRLPPDCHAFDVDGVPLPRATAAEVATLWIEHFLPDADEAYAS